jgi:hypothetical protein
MPRQTFRLDLDDFGESIQNQHHQMAPIAKMAALGLEAKAAI